jgi:flavin-binding protein dodecin
LIPRKHTETKEIPMTTHAEHAKGPAVVRVAEMVGISTKGWEDAANQVVARASQSIRHITGLDLLRSTAVVRDGQIAEYHVTVKLAFIVEPADIDS